MNGTRFLQFWKAAVLSAASLFLTVQADQQEIPLVTGWNLIALQLMPTNANPASVFAPLGSDFVGVWTMDNETKRWSSYTLSTNTTDNRVARMAPVAIGRAYLVYMNAAAVLKVTGTPPAFTPGVELTTGWNLIGIPTGKAALPKPVNILSVLTASGLDFDTVLKWELGFYRKFTPVDGDVDDFTVFDANKGHWVNVKSPAKFNLQPHALSSVLPDVDVEPQGNYPGPEDTVISAASGPRGPGTQTHIVFFPDEDTQTVAIVNTGGGILAWEMKWNATSATNIDWLQMSATEGITTIEPDEVRLFLDRTQLPKGDYHGNLVLHTTAGDRRFEVVAHVPDVHGEWRGSATIATVNGKKNPVAEIDLHLDFFEDPSVPGLVRGLLDSSNSLLWPVDVPLIGHSGSLSENRFTLGGGFILPPGDQNNPPYPTFASAGESQDVDWNCNGLLDNINPFPFPIYRSVQLQGALASSSLAGGTIITGSYVETVHGMMRQPILLEGTFKIRRESAKPFANRRVVVNQEATNGTQAVVWRTFQPPTPLTLPIGRATNTLQFITEMVLQSISVEVDFGEAPAAAIKLSLESPTGVRAILHDRANLGTLRGLSFPGLRRPVEALDLFGKAGVPTKGGWKLIVENSGSVPGKLFSWSLKMQGQPVFNIAGRVGTEGGAGLPAIVTLDGLPVNAMTMANADGSFVFERLPGIPANFIASQAGFEAVNPSRPGLAGVYTTPAFGGTCVSDGKTALAAKFRPLPAMPVPAAGTEGFANYGAPGSPVVMTLRPRPDLANGIHLLLSPSSGFGPLTVQMTLTGDSGAIPAGANVVWSFGDGSNANGIDLTTINHTYATSSQNGYEVIGEVGTTRVTNKVLVMPSPGNSTNIANFFQVAFTGGGSVPTDLIFTMPSGLSDPSSPPVFADLVMIQHADCASFDLDRAPYTTAENREFHTDGFTNGVPSLNSADYMHGFKGEDNNYQVSVAEWDLAAECGYTLDDDLFNPHPKPGATGECKSMTRYRMLCNIGPQILPPADSEVLAVPTSGPTPQFPTANPSFTPENNQIAKARDLRLVTGPLAWAWKPNQPGDIR